MSIILTDSSVPLSGAGDTLARNVIATLNKHYPAMSGGWIANINERGGLVRVMNTKLSGKMGFILHMSQIDPGMKAVVRAGGELLERYRIARSRVVNIDKVLADQQRNWLSELVPDK